MALDSVGSVRRELGRIYRLALNGHLPWAEATRLANLPATLIALAVAVAFYAFAIRWRAEVIVIGGFTALIFFLRWLYRYHPMAFIILVSFFRGLCGR